MKFLIFQWVIPLAFSIPHNQGFRENESQSGDLQHLEREIVHSLRLPHDLARKDLSPWGSRVYGPLKSLAFNEKIPMRTRWKSFMVYTQMAGGSSLPIVNQALKHQDWFMRSAALTALEKIDESLVRIWAFRKLDEDPALMVRARAFDILQKWSGEDIRELFWKKLYSADSFHNDRSLWIRKSLAMSLMEKPEKKDISRWVRLLHGSDDDLQQVAAMALFRINSGRDGEGRDSSLRTDVSFWKKQYPDNKSL